jgi:hypothetical protein
MDTRQQWKLLPKTIWLWQQQIHTCRPGDDRTGAHNKLIIVNASTSIQQQEINGNQPSAQPRSANTVDTSTHNNGIIVNEPISVQQEQSIITQETVQPHSVIQHSQHELPNINSPRVETATDNNDNHVNASSGIQQKERVIAASTKKQLSPDEDMRLPEASGNNSPPMPNSAPLHRTEMIINVVQDIDENIKVFINKMFHRRDKETNTLKQKVDKLKRLCGIDKKMISFVDWAMDWEMCWKSTSQRKKKAIEANMLWRSVADIVLKLMCVLIVTVGRRGTNQLHLLEQYLDVLVKHTTEIPPPTALVEVRPWLP